jgi:hypothetical protein
MLIWWTNQADCEAIDDAFPNGGMIASFPAYLQDQYASRYGRNGRGRLWVSSRFGKAGISDWPSTPMGQILGERSRLGQTYAGIVIRDEDALLLDEMPGIITTFDLKRWQG